MTTIGMYSSLSKDLRGTCNLYCSCLIRADGSILFDQVWRCLKSCEGKWINAQTSVSFMIICLNIYDFFIGIIIHIRRDIIYLKKIKGISVCRI